MTLELLMSFDLANGTMRNTKSCTKRPMRVGRSAYLKGVRFGEFRMWMRFAARQVPFEHRIQSVVSVGSDGQMIKVATSWIIATVQETHSVWHRAVLNFEQQSMDPYFCPTNPDTPIPVIVTRT